MNVGLLGRYAMAARLQDRRDRLVMSYLNGPPELTSEDVNERVAFARRWRENTEATIRMLDALIMRQRSEGGGAA